MKRKCRRVLPLLERKLAHELSEADEARLAQHLDTCSACAERARAWERADSELRRLGPVDAAPGAGEAMADRVSVQIDSLRLLPTMQPWRTAMGAGALVSAAISIAALLLVFVIRDDEPPEMALIDRDPVDAATQIPWDEVWEDVDRAYETEEADND